MSEVASPGGGWWKSSPRPVRTADRGSPQKLGISEDRGERGAQLVRHRRISWSLEATSISVVWSRCSVA